MGGLKDLKGSAVKIDKQYLPILVSVILSLITFLTIWNLGVVSLPAIYIILQVVVVVWIFSLLLLQFRPQLKKNISYSAIVSAFIIYLGALFISLSRFKEAIAKGDIDISMVGVGLALLAIGVGLTTQRKEQQANDKNLAQNSTNEVSDEEKETRTDEELPSIDIVLDEVRRTLDFQFELLDGLVTKSGIVLGVSGVILALLVTSLLGQSDLANLLLVEVALVLIFLSLILSFISISMGKWDKPPQLERLRSHYISEPANETKLKIIDIVRDAIEKNDDGIKMRVRLWKSSYFILAIGLGLLAVWIGIVVWQ